MSALAADLNIETLTKPIASDKSILREGLNQELALQMDDISFLNELLAQKLSIAGTKNLAPENVVETVRDILASDSNDDALISRSDLSSIISPELLEHIMSEIVVTPQELQAEVIEGQEFSTNSRIRIPNSAEFDFPETSPEHEGTTPQNNSLPPLEMSLSQPPTEIPDISQDEEEGHPPLQLDSHDNTRTAFLANTEKRDVKVSEPLPPKTDASKTESPRQETSHSVLPSEENLQPDLNHLSTGSSQVVENFQPQLLRVDIGGKQNPLQALATVAPTEIESAEPAQLTSFETLSIPKTLQQSHFPQPVQFAFGHHTNAQGDQHLKIHLLPAELGHIRVDLKVDGMTGEKTVNMIFASPQTFDLFKDNTQSLQQMLIRAGYDVAPEQITMHHPGEELRENLENFFAQQQQHQRTPNKNNPQNEDEETEDNIVMTNINRLMNVSA